MSNTVAKNFLNRVASGQSPNTSTVVPTAGATGMPMLNRQGRPTTGTNGEERPKAQFWLNPGYSIVTQVAQPDGSIAEVPDFIGTPYGLPLDTMSLLDTTSRNIAYSQKRAASNDLLTQILESCKHLAPGEDMIFGEPGGLQWQIRRVNAEVTPVEGSTESGNPFARKLALVASGTTTG